jgi:hypothetical protein
MVKKIGSILILALAAAGGISAQEAPKNNTAMFLGSMLSYERTLSEKLGVGADVALDFFGIPTMYYDGEKSDTNDYAALLPFSVDAFARLYPWAGRFFVQLGLGVQMSTFAHSSLDADNSLNAFGFHAKLQAGWKFDIGQPNGWVFEGRLGPGISVGGVSHDGETVEKASYFLFSFPIQLGFGLKF